MTSPLPPLPLIDNHLFIDNTFLEKLNACERAVEYAYLHRRVASHSAAALNFGGALHHALAYRYANCPDYVTPDETSKIHSMLSEWFQTNPNPEEDYQNLDLATRTIDAYNSAYMGEEFKTLTLSSTPAVELPFVFPLCRYQGINIMYCGRIDLAVHIDNQLFVVDHKTTSIMGEQFFQGLSVSPQMMGYCAGIEQLLPTEKCYGFLVNVIKKTRPTKLNGLKIPRESFQRLKVYLNPGTLAEWRRNTIALIEAFITNYYKGFLPQKKTWCVNKYGRCEYLSVCQLEDTNRPLALATGEFRDNIWSPLNDFHESIIQLNRNAKEFADAQKPISPEANV